MADILAGHLAFVLLPGADQQRRLPRWWPRLFGALHSGWALAILPVVLLLGLAVAAPDLRRLSASITSDSYLSMLFRFAVIPMTLFSGVFFPVESLPTGLRWLAYASPLWHGVDLCRAATLGVAPQLVGRRATCSTSPPGRVVGWLLARARFRRRLVL